MVSTCMLHAEFFHETMKRNGINVPECVTNEVDISVPFEQYPQANLYLKAHLGLTIDLDALDSNAQIIAKLTPEQCKTVTMDQLREMGVGYGIEGYWV